MTAKPAPKSKVQAITKPMHIPKAITLATVTAGVEDALTSLAGYVTNALAKPELIAPCYDQLSHIADTVDSVRETVKGAIRKLVTETGSVTTEKGSKELVLGEWRLSIRPTKTGIDGKKFEALLRAKSYDPGSFMDSVLTYKLNDAKTLLAVEQKVVTSNELDACKADGTFAVQPPERVS